MIKKHCVIFLAEAFSVTAHAKEKKNPDNAFTSAIIVVMMLCFVIAAAGEKQKNPDDGAASGTVCHRKATITSASAMIGCGCTAVRTTISIVAATCVIATAIIIAVTTGCKSTGRC